jgi:pimeloyl-ACP methyl ester carboxylesterase
MKARIAGTELRYEDTGAGSAVLFLHAFPLGLFMWEEQVAVFGASHRLVRFDARGFGGTPAGDEPLAMDRIADDAAALLDHLGIARAVVVGCSMGGYAAFAMFRRHATRIQALVLQNTRSTADSDEARKNRGLLAERVLREGAAAAADAFLPKLVGETTNKDRPERIARLRKAILENPPPGIANALLGLGARVDSTPTARDISDLLTPPSEARALHSAIPGSRLEIIPRAGHLSNLENPEAYNRILGSFLPPIEG